MLQFQVGKNNVFMLYRKEMKMIQRTAYFRALSTSLSFILPNLLILLMFVTHVLMGNKFTVPEVRKIIIISSDRNVTRFF